jgi:hypothetical protein
MPALKVLINSNIFRGLMVYKLLIYVCLAASICLTIYTFDSHLRASVISRQNDLLSIAWMLGQCHEEIGEYPDSTLESCPEISHRMKRHERIEFASALRYRSSEQCGFILEETKCKLVNIYSTDRLILDGVQGLRWEKSGKKIANKIWK